MNENKVNENKMNENKVNEKKMNKNKVNEKKNNYNNIIKIQSICRMYNMKRRYLCTNNIDLITMDNIYNIKSIYIYIYTETKINKSYCFDIRYFNELFNMKKNIFNKKDIINPFTNNKLTELDINNIKKQINYITEKGYTIEFEENILTDKQKINSYAIETFHKIDLLGNYTDVNWFNNLNRYKLIKLYTRTHNIFYNRIRLTKKERKKYVKNGLVFKMKLNKIKKIKEIDTLKKIILNEYNKFIDFDNDISNKKTAVIWLLIGLTEVSNKAREDLHYLL